MLQHIKSRNIKAKSDLANEPALVLALSRNQHQHFAPLYARNSFEIIETADWQPKVIRETMPDLLLTPSCDWYESAACIAEARHLGIPCLYVMDGILEWRHQWENPRFGAGGGVPYNQPIIADKIACLGWQSVRTLEAWGNIGKCELVGSPRFDTYLVQPVKSVIHSGPKRLLVMTANTPGFTPDQLALIERSLLDAKEYLETQSDWEPIWRVQRGLDVKLGLHDNYLDLRNKPLREVMNHADAVLTTPSTVLLESMLANLPTALLDYTNSPPYVAAAWSITAQEHFKSVLTDLFNPPVRRLALQDEILHNNLECRTPATPRMIHLIEKMIQIAWKSRETGKNPKFPSRILPIELGGQAIPSEYFDLARLYPNHPVFANQDQQSLQIELCHAKTQILTLQRQLKWKIKLASYVKHFFGKD